MTILRESYIKMLALLGVVGTFFALMSASTSTPWPFFYEPKMPESLIKED